MARRGAIALLLLLLAACALPVADAAIPSGMADEVESARQALRLQEDGPRSNFGFRALRCRADGGLLVVFERSGVLGGSLAYAMQGPGAGPDNWAGGLRVHDLEGDPEIRLFFAESPEVACPA